MASEYLNDHNERPQLPFWQAEGVRSLPDEISPEELTRSILKERGEASVHPDSGNNELRAQWDIVAGGTCHLFSGSDPSSSNFILDVRTLESDGQFRYRYGQNQNITFEHPHDCPNAGFSQEELNDQLHQLLSAAGCGEGAAGLPKNLDTFDMLAGQLAVEIVLSREYTDIQRFQLQSQFPKLRELATTSLFEIAKQEQLVTDATREAFMLALPAVVKSKQQQDREECEARAITEPMRVPLVTKPWLDLSELTKDPREPFWKRWIPRRR